MEIEPNNTVWLGSRFTEHIVAIHFYPYAYSADAPPLPWFLLGSSGERRLPLPRIRTADF